MQNDHFEDSRRLLMLALMLVPEHVIRGHRAKSFLMRGSLAKVVLINAALLSLGGRWFTKQELTEATGTDVNAAITVLRVLHARGLARLTEQHIATLKSRAYVKVYHLELNERALNAARKIAAAERTRCPYTDPRGYAPVLVHPDVLAARDHVWQKTGIDPNLLDKKTTHGYDARKNMAKVVRRMYPGANVWTVLVAMGVPESMVCRAMYPYRKGERKSRATTRRDAKTQGANT